MLATRLRLALGVVALGLIGLGAYGLAQAPAPAQNNNPFVPLTPPAVANTLPPAGQNSFDPFSANVLAQSQPKAEKVAAKGIEDDDVPYAASPSQAVVRIEGDKLIVRQRVSRVVSVPVQNVPGQPVVAWQRKSDVQATTHDPADISVFDMKGNRLQPKALKDKFNSDVHALVAFDGKLPNPRELALYKDDTLLVVLPAPAGQTATYGATTVAEPLVAPPASRSIPPSTTTPAPAHPPGNLRPTTPPTALPGTPRPVTPPPAIPPGGTDLPPDPLPTAPAM